MKERNTRLGMSLSIEEFCRYIVKNILMQLIRSDLYSAATVRDPSKRRIPMRPTQTLAE